jgi:hypothetical protein
MDTIEYRKTTWPIEFRGAAASTRAQCADHRVVVDGAKTNDAMVTNVRHEDFPRRRHQGDINGTLQRAGGSRQLPHPRAIQSPQHRHPTVVAIRHEEEILVRGERQATWVFELAALVTLKTDGALPLALHLGKSRGSKRDMNTYCCEDYRRRKKTDKNGETQVQIALVE